MGSLSSGRRSCSANVKQLVEENISISIHDLNKRGLLFPGDLFYIDFITSSGDRLSLSVQVQTDSIDMQYRFKNQRYTQNVSILHQSCRLGGKRPYFICPQCFQKRVDLYFGKTAYFLCRTCLQYGYRSQRLNSHQRHANRAMHLKKKLSGTGQPYFAIKKPKGMWNRTFNKILDQIIMHEMASYRLFAEYFYGVVEKYNSQIKKISNDSV